MLNESLIAFMMAGNPHNLTHRDEVKNCRNYFHDFQLFLRRSLRSTDYQKLMAYPPEKSNKLAYSVLNLFILFVWHFTHS